MNSLICKTHISDKIPSRSIVLSHTLINHWRLINGQSIRIELGNKSTIIRVLRSKLPGLDIFLSSVVARQLSLPKINQIRAIMSNKTLKLGPVIGILTTGFTGNTDKPFGNRSLLFRTFLQESINEKPLIYVFTPEMINWQTKTVMGWYYQNARWNAQSSPLPNVVYERVPNRKAESLQRVKTCIQRLKESENCQVFNQGFFNKWSIHQLLSNHPNTSMYIPETYLSPSLHTLEQILKKHPMVYLKPSGGSLGLGIFRITHHPKHGYFSRFHQGNQNVLHRFTAIDKLIRNYFSNQPNRFQKYLVQQGIHLMKYKGNPVDFRIHMHKDSRGEWKVVAIASKVAGSGCVTTHIRTGGSLLSTYELLQHVFHRDAAQMKRKLQQTAITIAQVLEEQIEGPIGELGLDIGIDQNQHIWLFEINAKPGRHIFHHPSLRKAGKQSAKYITDYSLNLADFV